MLSGKKVNRISFLIIVVFLVLVAMASILCAGSFARIDSSFEQTIAELLKENEEKVNSGIIFDENSKNNEASNPLNPDAGDNNDETNVAVGQFDKFIDLFNYAFNNYKTVKNIYSVGSGKISATGKYGPVSITNVPGKISMTKAKNANGQKYFDYYIDSTNKSYPFSMYVLAYGKGLNYNVFYPKTGWQDLTQNQFKEIYRSDLDFWFYFLDETNHDVVKFQYDKFTKKYLATVNIKGSALTEYAYYIHQYLELTEDAKFNSCQATFSFNQYAQFESVSVKENFNIKSTKSGIDLRVDSVYAETFKVLGNTFVSIQKPKI